MEPGASREANTDKLKLDFGGLFSAEPQEKSLSRRPGETRKEESNTNTQKEKNPPTKPQEALQGQQAKDLYVKRQIAKNQEERSLEICQEYQQNIRKSSELQAEILKGISAGEDVYSLLLKAVKAISLMTGNELFFFQAEADILAIYGDGLKARAPLQRRIDQTKERLEHLLRVAEMEPDGDSLERMRRSIRAHEARIGELEAEMERAS